MLHESPDDLLVVPLGVSGTKASLAPAFVAQAEALIEAGQSAAAMPLLLAIVAQNPANPCPHELLASLYLADDTFHDAARHAELALACGSTSAAVHDVLFDAALGLGKIDEAVAATERSTRELGPSLARMRRAGHLLVTAGHFGAAVEVLRSAAQAFGADADLRFNLAHALHRDGANDEALALVQQCICQDAASLHYRNFLVHLLVQTKALGAAIEAQRHVVNIEPDQATHRQTLSGLLDQNGAASEALSEAIRAIKLAPDNAALWVHAAGVARKLGHRQEAIEFLRRAALLAASDPEVHFSLAWHLFADQYTEEALEAVAISVRLAPLNSRYRDFRITILQQRQQDASQTLPSAGPILRPLPRSSDRSPHNRHRLMIQARAQARVIWALSMRDIQLRDAKSRFGIATVIIEPVMHILTLWAVMSVMMHGRPPLGEHWFFFYATGIIPFLLVIHLASHGLAGHAAHKHMLDVPIIKSQDMLLAAALSELVISMSVAVLMFSILYMFGMFSGISNISAVISAYMSLWVFGFGLMLVNHTLVSVIPIWAKIWYSLQRSLYFISGIFYMAQFMPGYIRDILVWNPMLVGIEWFRNGFFQQYQPPWLDRTYLVSLSFGLLLTGFILEHGLRHRMK